MPHDRASTLRATRPGLTACALLPVLLNPFLASPAHAAGDAYPYRTDATQTRDPWGFTKRQCVSYAAWRLSRAGHAISNSRNQWGSASHWDEAAGLHHVRVGVTPAVGAIAQWNANERTAHYPGGYLQAGAYGHVAVVIATYPDKSAMVEQYNATGTRSYSRMHVSARRYLYFR